MTIFPTTRAGVLVSLTLLLPSITSSRHTNAFVAPITTRSGGDDLSLLFPPRTRPTSLLFEDEGLSVFEQPFYTTCDIKTRMSIIKMGKDVLVYSPIAATPNCLAQVEAAVGAKPTHILMQNNAVDHTLFLSKWIETYPNAQVLAVSPSSPTELAVTNGEEVLLPSSWKGTLDAAVLDVPFFREVVLLHKPSKTLICADSIWQVISPKFSPTVVADVGWVMFGVKGVSRFPYWFYNPRVAKDKVQSFVDRVSTFDFNRVVTGHLDGIDGVGAKAKDVFLQSFDYILR